MKTAEEWEQIPHDNHPHNWCSCECEYGMINTMIPWIKQIQLDAIKEGARRAAEFCEERRRFHEVAGTTYLAGESLDCRKGISFLLEQWTQEDLK